ncbi:hypothetical protein CIHG_02011 [Coccidioides immitis H538.4]|uniref:Uncharacterized protein n=3 Tax=Coccidioides immitis TaxID=5501 RepID=A0A0J8QR08_COCIT|nr:hypothetical protein CIRG_06327 [Coccidioides immitis RMSCC 2394]KMU73668.1 hypothetical protein CISG_03718 [Coccidioides immitis RMSCC 3703]KMU84225.1 hypothetical protein CIHG_02011 [Coccidioides immitis H538.4]
MSVAHWKNLARMSFENQEAFKPQNSNLGQGEVLETADNDIDISSSMADLVRLESREIFVVEKNGLNTPVTCWPGNVRACTLLSADLISSTPKWHVRLHLASAVPVA